MGQDQYQNPNIEAVLRTLSKEIGSEIGEMKGEFNGLKSYIHERTTNCSDNYDSLTKQMNNLASKINGVVIERRVEERLSGTFKKLIYNRVTLLCTILTLVLGFMGFAKIQYASDKKIKVKLVKLTEEIKSLQEVAIDEN